jgi:glycosyltransferase involved in cell wall biosynthesis
LIHEGIGPYNAIARIAQSQVQLALEAGWRVSVVAKFLDPSLHGEVEWLKLYVPPRLLLVQWTTARAFIRAALGGRTFDVIHAHQPQVASLSDVFQCHFLTRVAYERHCLETRSGLGPGIVRAQQQGVLYAEDYFYLHWNPATHMLFCSEYLRQEFGRVYGLPPREEVLVNAVPPMSLPTPDERRAARTAYLGEAPRAQVVGYLGGLDERKGYRPLLKALEQEPDLTLLMGGLYSDSFEPPAALRGRAKGVGLVKDTKSFYDACDVLVVPSHFDPCPLVPFEAAARGVPVIATEGVGNLPTLQEYGAGLEWKREQPLGPVVRQAIAQRAALQDGAGRMSAELSERGQGERVLARYEQVLQEKASPSAVRAGQPERGGATR